MSAPLPEDPVLAAILARLNAVQAQLRVLKTKVSELEHRQSV